MTIQIEKGIPIPAVAWRGQPVLPDSPLSTMEVGDSFRLPKHKQPRIGILAQRAKIQLLTRTINETDIRVWRVR